MNEPMDTSNYLELPIPDEGLGAIKVLFTELEERIERTITNQSQKSRALRDLRSAMANCYSGVDGPH